MKSTGELSAEIQESLNNFKVIIAFNRRDYFRKKFEEINNQNYRKALDAGIANTVLIPVYGLLASFAQLIVLTYGIYLIAAGEFSIGLLVSYLAYATNFYNPLRQLAALWTNFQVAMAGWDRVSYILNLESNLPVIATGDRDNHDDLMEFRNVHFGYPGGKEILHDINFRLGRGKTYALVGPTGGGKTTTASLIARLYDPVSGEVSALTEKTSAPGSRKNGQTKSDLFYRSPFCLPEPYGIIFCMVMKSIKTIPTNNWKQ